MAKNKANRFTRHERIDIFLMQERCCAHCGAELEPGWHAVHKVPPSQGGKTEVANGMGLCPTCSKAHR
jgi:hypothetical protein